MTLYLKVTVGRANYLIAATQVTDLGPADEGADPAVSVVDCRTLFDEPSGAPGYRVQIARDGAEPLCLVVDRLDGLVELGEDVFRPLPPIGRFGRLIDAVAIPVAAAPPALLLHVGSAPLAGASFPRGERDAEFGEFADR